MVVKRMVNVRLNIRRARNVSRSKSALADRWAVLRGTSAIILYHPLLVPRRWKRLHWVSSR
jgi:hypothetical protein